MKTSKAYNIKFKHLKLGVILGAGIGLCTGILTNSIALSLSLGAGVGLIFGVALRTGVKKENEN